MLEVEDLWGVTSGSDVEGMGRVDLGPYVPNLAATWDARVGDRRWAEVDGSLVSADISGFTKLSERLAGLGREGAEELTSLLNGRFTAMIAVAARHGGDVLKFGGDALLVLFTGPRHAERATLASLGMRATVDAPLESMFAGRVRLRMSIGIHSGTFAFFLVDGGHRELLVTGSAATTTVTCEGEAKAGEVLVSHDTAALLPRRWLGARHPHGRLVRRVVDLDELIDLTDGSGPQPDLHPFVPAAQRATIASGAVGEHRQVTTAFVKFSGTDHLVDEAGPAALADRLQGLAEVVAEAVTRHDIHWLGSDVYPDGGKIILTAGAPTTVDDDEERMLRVVRAVLDGTHDLELRAGVHCGPVFAGLVGAPRRRTFTVMGDAVNLAARLMQKAGAGELVASQEVLDRSATRFEVAPLEPFLVKGKSQPIRASVVGQVLHESAADRSDDLPFVGRQQELEIARAAARRVAAGSGWVLDVVGEPGVGKSRLLEQVQAEHPDLPAISVRCSPYGRTTPYFAMRPLLRQLAGIAPDADADAAGRRLQRWVAEVAPAELPWVPFVAMLVDASVPSTPEADRIAPAFQRPTTHRAVGGLLAAAVRTPTLVVVEDAHLIDDASEALLRELLPLVTSTPILVWIARRPGPTSSWASDGAGQVIDLGALPPAATDELIAELGASMDPGVLEVLVARSGGNPLFLRELLTVAASGGTDAMPESLERLITARIDTLAAADRMLLRDAAVLGTTADLEILATVRPDAATPARWRHLGGFLSVDDGQVRFQHALYQQVAYEGLSYERRRQVHRQVGEALEHRHGEAAAEIAALLSEHFSLGHAHERAWRYATVAGDQARGKHAPVEAATHYQRALQSAGPAGVPGPEVARISEALGDVEEVAARYEDAIAAYRSARRLCADPADDARLLRKEGILRERVGRYTQALRWYGRGLTTVAKVDDPAARHEQVELALAYAGVRYRQGRYRECVRWAHRAVEAIERGATGGVRPDATQLAALAHAFYLLDLGYTYLGSAERADYRGRALPLYEELGDLLGQANVLNNLGIAAYQEGSWAEALSLYEQARAASERVGDVVGTAMGINNIGEILSDQGHLDRAVELLRVALASWRRSGYLVGVAEATSNLGRAEARAGRTDEALALLDESLTWFTGVEATGLALRDAVRHAECLLLAGRCDEARVELDDIAARFRSAEGDPVDQAALARLDAVAHLAAGNVPEATRSVDAAVRQAEACGAAYELGNALLLRAAITGHPEDATRGRQILDQLGVVRTWLVPDDPSGPQRPVAHQGEPWRASSPPD